MLPLPVTNNNNCGSVITVDTISAGELRKLCMQVTDKDGCPINILEATSSGYCPDSPNSSSSSNSTSSSSLSFSSSSYSNSSSSMSLAFSSSSSSNSSSSSSFGFVFSSSSSSTSSESSVSSSSSSSSGVSDSSSSYSSSSSSSDSSNANSSSSSSSFSVSSSSSSTVAASGLPAGWSAVYRAKQLYSTAKMFSYLMTVDDARVGAFHVTLAPESIKRPGVFLAEIAIYDDEQNLRFSDMRYLKVNPSLECSNYGAIMPSDIRMALWDYCPESNTLLDDYEFPEEQIIYMIRRPLDLWNELSPGGVYIATPDNFQWRENWLRCVVGFLLVSAGRLHRRNSLDYSAAGLTVADNADWQAYIQEGEMLINQFKEWAQNKKVEINISRGYGTLGSSYQ